MPKLVRNPDPRKKPPYGSRLDPYHPLSQGLVGCWLMNEGGGNVAYDIAKKSRLNFNGSLRWTSDYISNFSNSSYLSAPDENQFEGFEEYSIAFRCLRTGSLSTDSGSRIFDKNGGVLACSFQPNFFRVWDGAWYSVAYTMPSNTAITGAVVFNGASIKKFIDGSLIGSNNKSGAVGTGSGTFYVGIQNVTYYQPWPGYLWYLQYYNRALTDSEILQLYEEPYGHILVPQYWYMVDFGAVAGGTTTINSDLIIVFDIYGRVASGITALFDIYNAIQSDLTALFDIKNTVQSSLTALFDINGRVQSDITSVFDIAGKVNSDVTAVFDVLNQVGSSVTALFNILNSVESDVTAQFDIFSKVQSDLTSLFDVYSKTNSSLTLVYDMAGKVQSNLTILFDILGNVDLTKWPWSQLPWGSLPWGEEPWREG